MDISLSSYFIDGNIKTLREQNSPEVALALQHAYDLFLSHCESRVCRNIVGGEVQKQAYKMESPLFDALDNVIAKLLELKIPDIYKILIRRSRYVLSINYGKALDSLDGD